MADSLRPDQSLFSANNDTLVSNNGQYRLVMQSDGNLVLYDQNNSALWATGTDGNPGSFLVIQDDGNVVVYKPNQPIWATGTNR